MESYACSYCQKAICAGVRHRPPTEMDQPRARATCKYCHFEPPTSLGLPLRIRFIAYSDVRHTAFKRYRLNRIVVYDSEPFCGLTDSLLFC